MRKAPIILSGFFIFVTLNRVSKFSSAMGDANISIAFSLGLGVTIFAASYWTQYKGNNKQSETETSKIAKVVGFAWVVLVTATLIDGIFNLAHVLSEHTAGFFTVVYGITPTAIALLLGIMQARIDVLPKLNAGSKLNLWRTFTKAIERTLNNFGARAKKMQDDLDSAQSKIARLQEKANRLQGAQDENKTLQGENKTLQDEIKSVQFSNAVLQGDLDNLQEYKNMVQGMSQKYQAAARYIVGDFANLDEAASAAQCNPSTISRIAKSMNRKNNQA